MNDLTEKEALKLNEIKKVIIGECTKKEASNNLGITIRQIDRLILKYKNEGDIGFIHKNRSKESKKKISEDIKIEIVNLYITEYFDYNFTHFYEEIREKYKLSRKTISTILSEADIISPEAQHKTVKLYNANMKKAICQKEATEEQITVYQKRQEAEKQKHIRRSSLLYNYGQEIQMDAAFAMWYGEKPRALHLAVDKATKRVLYGWFDIQETTRAYFVMLMNIILKYGIPQKIKTDKRGTFSINNVKTKSNLNTTQFGRICKELEINLKSSSDPLFKPNVERENKTFKGRLIAELRHENIIDDKEIAYDNTLWCYVKENLYKLLKINAPEKKVYQKTTKTIEEINRSKAHKPAPNHPWRTYKKN